jgi:hypothetical protein
MEGRYLWYYALLVDDIDMDTFYLDLNHALDRLHPSDRPLDFLVAAYTAVEDVAEANSYVRMGIDRDCKPLQHPPLKTTASHGTRPWPDRTSMSHCAW